MLGHLFLLALFAQAFHALYVVEVFFVIDNKVVQSYMVEETTGTNTEKRQRAIANIRADVNYFVAEVNHLYAGTGLGIQIRSRKLLILGSNVITGSVTEQAGLQAFDDWLTTKKSYANLRYDAAVFWTGFDLLSSSTLASTPSGLAHEGSICNGEHASAIVEFTGTYHTAYVTAHEIAHILGSSHDKVNQGYIMSTESSTIGAYRWSFSSASITSMRNVIIQRSCLSQTSTATLSLSGPVTNSLKDPDVICQRALRSQETYMLKSASLYGNQPPQGDIVCKEIKCQSPMDANQWLSAFPSEGLTCGANKVCRDGSCQNDASAGTGSIDVNCIWGDEKIFSITVGGQYFQGSCSQFISQYGERYCTLEQISTPCCGTCASYLSTSSGTSGGSCPNGDQQPSITIKGVPFTGTCADLVSTYGKPQICGSSLKDVCCASCA